MKLLIISGISGSGKSVVCNTLEDLGYFCVDNLPVEMLEPFILLYQKQHEQKMAIVVDSRSKNYAQLLAQLNNFDKSIYSLVFIDCKKDVILNRYKQTRRKHPLMNDEISLPRAIDLEYAQCEPIKQASDYVFDTSNITVNVLKQEIIDAFKGNDYQGMSIKVISFGYRNSIPIEADLIFDVRCLLNPYYQLDLKHKTGLESEVVEYIFSDPASKKFTDKIADFLLTAIPMYQKEGKLELVIGFGCTGGHHRSVAVAEIISNILKEKYHTITVHRDIEKEY